MRDLRRLGSLSLVIALMAGCAASRSDPKADDAQVKQFSGRGYLTDDQYGVATSSASWPCGGAACDVALTVPSKPGRYPLVIYLPGLGEGPIAGEAWRTAWTRAGYAVLSLQPLAEDAGAWSSARARTGDFALLARERYSGKAMSERLGALHDALRQLARRHAAAEPPLERVDLSRIAVAGFDLGAFTAMAIAGEDVRDVVVPQLPVSIRAVIALSPYASFSGPSFASRYGAIRLPVLSLTSDADGDALGVVTGAHLRRAPFEHMPAGDKYLALLAGMPHGVFSGASTAPAGEPDHRPADSRSPSRPAGPTGGRGGSGGHGHFSGASAAAAGSHGSDSSGRRSAGRADGGHGDHGAPAENLRQRASPTELAIGVAAVQAISTAFLDAIVKEDKIAREWLEKDASRWLQGKGELRRR